MAALIFQLVISLAALLSSLHCFPPIGLILHPSLVFFELSNFHTHHLTSPFFGSPRLDKLPKTTQFFHN